MQPLATFNIKVLVVSAAMVASSFALAEAKDSGCPEGICIPSFEEAQGGSIEMTVDSTDFSPGKIQCEFEADNQTITFFNPSEKSEVQSTQFGNSAAAKQSCVVKSPSRTTGIHVFECSLSTQFSNVDSSRKLKRHHVSLTLVYPFMGDLYATVELASLLRNSERKLVKVNTVKFSPDSVQCVTQNHPRDSASLPESTSSLE
jgi:hypothetical protein